MNPHQLARLFPGASKSCLAANAADYGDGKPSDQPAKRVDSRAPAPNPATLTPSGGQDSAPPRCSFAECGKPAARNGLCHCHAKQQYLGKELSLPQWKLWSESEIAAIKAAYGFGLAFGDLDRLAQLLGRRKNVICRKANELGLTDIARKHVGRKPPMSKREVALKISLNTKASQRANGHPRGMAGKQHTNETKERLAFTSSQLKPSPESVLQGMKTRAANGTLVPKGGRVSWKAGWREIGGGRIYARSRWEANYARYLQFLMEHGEIEKWEHEPETFWFEAIKRGCRSYLPDFRVTLNSGKIEYHETKGWMDDRSVTKLKRMKKYHPDVVLILRDSAWFRANGPKLRGIIQGWESDK